MSAIYDLPRFEVFQDGVRTRVSSGAVWESKVGYSRAVRIGSQIFVTGTVGVLLDGSYPPTASWQARRALRIIQAALGALGADLKDVVRTRMFVTDISEWQQIGAVHAEFFGEIRPATTMVQVAKLIDPDAKVEIEMDAIAESA